MDYEAHPFEIVKEIMAVADYVEKHHADLFAIRDRLGESIDNYSHGMQQKLALIAALIHDPKLIVLDEPFVGLDPMATKSIRETFKTMAAEKGTRRTRRAFMKEPVAT